MARWCRGGEGHDHAVKEPSERGTPEAVDRHEGRVEREELVDTKTCCGKRAYHKRDCLIATSKSEHVCQQMHFGDALESAWYKTT